VDRLGPATPVSQAAGSWPSAGGGAECPAERRRPRHRDDVSLLPTPPPPPWLRREGGTARSPGACHPSVAGGRCLAGVGFMGGGAAGPAERRRPHHRVEDRDEEGGAINTHRGCCESRVLGAAAPWQPLLVGASLCRRPARRQMSPQVPRGRPETSSEQDSERDLRKRSRFCQPTSAERLSAWARSHCLSVVSL